MDRKKPVNQSIDYIMQHLHENLSLDIIAAQCFLSKYYLDRLFREETGESIYAFIKRCRMDQSAIDMKLQPSKSVTEIGLDYGYSSSNYSTVFKTHTHTSPTGFRQAVPIHSMVHPFIPEKIICFKTAEEYDRRIEIKELTDTHVVYERFFGSYHSIEECWYRFLEAHKAERNENTILIERFFNDPAITKPSQCFVDLCMSVEAESIRKDRLCIEGGKWAVYHYDGEIKDIFEALQGIFNVWLPYSGFTMARHYGLNIYREIDREQHKVRMDLCIPVHK